MPDLLNVCSDFGNTLARPRDTTRPVVLVGFKRQGNLGLGYLASTLRARGYPVEILDFEDPYEKIRDAVLQSGMEVGAAHSYDRLAEHLATLA